MGVTFLESVITLKASTERATRKVKGQESRGHLGFLKDLGHVIVEKGQTKSGLLAPYNLEMTMDMKRCHVLFQIAAPAHVDECHREITYSNVTENFLVFKRWN